MSLCLFALLVLLTEIFQSGMDRAITAIFDLDTIAAARIFDVRSWQKYSRCLALWTTSERAVTQLAQILGLGKLVELLLLLLLLFLFLLLLLLVFANIVCTQGYMTRMCRNAAPK